MRVLYDPFTLKTFQYFFQYFHSTNNNALSMLFLNKNNVRLTVYTLVDLFKDDDDGERRMLDVHGYEHKVIKSFIHSEYHLSFNGG